MKSKIKDILVQDPFLQFLPEPHKYYDLKRKKYVARSVSEVVKENTYVSKEMEKAAISFLDSPSTTSQVTYTLKLRSTNGATVQTNSNGSRGTITLMEIAG